MLGCILVNYSSTLEMIIFRFLLQERQIGDSAEVEASLQISMGQRIIKSWHLKMLREVESISTGVHVVVNVYLISVEKRKLMIQHFIF